MSDEGGSGTMLDVPGAGAEALDAWGWAAFGGEVGAARLAPWLALWQDEIGVVRGEDPEFEAWAAARTDWALVDMGAGAASMAGDPQWRELADSWVGLFEVWPTDGGPAWLRDRIGGACMPLAVPIDLRRETDGPAGLWELRGVVRGGRFVPCRPPIVYPRVLAAAWPAGRSADATAPQPDPSRPSRLLKALRRARIRHARTPRLDPRPAFLAAIRSAETIADVGAVRPGSD